MNIGVLARNDGDEEKDGTEIQRHGVVDEETTIAISFEAKSSSL